MPGNPRQDVQVTSAQAGRRPYVGDGAHPVGDDRDLAVRPGARTSGRWRLRNWRLRWKLLIVLLVPLVTALALGALRVTSQLQNANVYDKINEQLALSSSLSDVMDSLQREREQISLFVTSGGAFGTPPGGAATTAVDASVEAFRQVAANDTNLDAPTQLAVSNALNSLSDLSALRSVSSGTKFPEVDVLSGYNQILTSLLQSCQLLIAGAPDQRVNVLAGGLFELRQAKEEFSLSNAILMMTVTQIRNPDGTTSAGWVFLPGTQDQLSAANAEFDASISSFNSGASPVDRQMYLDTVTGQDVDTRAKLVTLIQQRAGAGLGPPAPGQENVQPTTVQNAGDATAGLLRDAELNMNSELKAQTNSLASAAKTQAFQDGGILAGALLIAFLVTLMVARSLVQSLRRLRSGALEVARSKLPQSVQRILADPDPIKASNKAVEPVPVFTADEIGEVARSFDVVHGQAVRLAAEQAVLRDNVNAIFINLSRRSQALVERQLALIDRLEKDEQDPDQLANLFELDHLATRMRRNSESLLVLSGSGLAKRMSRPVPIGELVGAAVSEVEQYARIDVGAPPAASVLGRVVNDLIHLVAELLDNATSYSEPNTRVSVRIARTRSRELAIQITDRGVGMSEDDVRLANERLANPPDIDVGVTRRMGLYVVARLARRHNIRVKLRANEDIDGGTVALIVIPEDLIHRPGEDAMGGGGGQLSTGDKLPPVPQPGIVDTFPPVGAMPVDMPVNMPVNAELAGAATAAAGIAGAFGLASARAAREDAAATAGGGANRLGAMPNPGMTDSGVHEPATSFWASDFEPHGKLEITDVQPAVTDTGEPVVASNAASLWEAHTAVDAVPVEITGEPWPTPAPGPSQQRPRPEVDAPTERLPIYEAVLSQWFRADEASNGHAYVATNGHETNGVGTNGNGNGNGASTVVTAALDVPEKQKQDPVGPLPTRVPGRAGAAAGFGTQDRLAGDTGPTPAPAVSSAPVTNGSSYAESNGDTDSWQTPADEGWQRAEALLAPVSETTTAGLPKRVPKAHLVPGSAAPRPDAASAQASGGGRSGRGTVAPPSLPPRTADAVRGRMSSFQQGLRRGRHQMIEAYSGEASHPSAHRADEEQE